MTFNVNVPVFGKETCGNFGGTYKENGERMAEFWFALGTVEVDVMGNFLVSVS